MRTHDQSSLEAIFDDMDDGVLVVAPHHVVVYANPAACRLLGTAQCELLERPLPFAIPEHRHTEIELPARGVALELRRSAATWRERPAQLITLREITQRQDVQLALYRQLVEQMHDSIVVTDLDGIVSIWNRGAERLFGYSEAEMLGKPIAQIYPPEERELVPGQVMAEILAQGQSTLEIIAVHKSGKLLEIQLSLSLLAGPDGKPQGLIGHSRDVSERKRADAALRRWERIFAHTRTGVGILGREGERLEVVNPALAAMHGCTIEELTGKPLHEVFASSVQASLPGHLETACARGHHSFEAALMRSEGTELPALIDITTVRGDQGEVVHYVVNVQDITERKRGEEILRQSEARYRALVQNFPDGDIFLFDRDLRLLAAEGANVNRIGRDFFVGRLVAEVTPPDVVRIMEPLYIRAFAGEEGECELDFGALVQRLRVVPIRDEQGRVYAGMVMSQDITKLKRIEREVRNLNARLAELLQREQQARADAESQRALLRVVVDQAPAMVCIFTGPEHVYRYVNEHYCGMTGRAEDTFIGRSIRESSPELEGQGIYEILDQVYASGQPFRTVEQLSLVLVDGVPHDRYHTTAYQPIRDASGQVMGVLVHIIDVTETVQARQVLEQKTSEIAQLNRELEERVAERTAQLQAANTELEAFAYSVSHDLRAPLRRIDGFSLALIEDCKDQLDEQGTYYLTRIRAASQQMGELIDDLLALSRVSRIDVQTGLVDLSAIARQILAILKENAPERQVTLTIAPDMLAWGDQSFLWIALENLLGNAWKFTSKTEAATIEVGTLERNGERVFFVRDNGAGFDPAYSARLFETFHRLHNPVEFPGTGIGLATVKRVIERHGGRIWADGAVNRGATFYFTLPTPAERRQRSTQA